MSATPAPATSSQFSGHVLTDDDRRRGGQRSGETRRERGKSVREQLAEKAAAEVDRIHGVFIEAMDATITVFSQDGDELGVRVDHATRIKAAQAFMAECFGRPHQAITGADGGPIEVAHSDVSVAKERVVSSVDEVAARRQLKTGTDG